MRSGDIETTLSAGLRKIPLKGKRLLLIIPDTTRTAPVGMLVKAVFKILHSCTKKIDVLVALGTHPPLSRREMLGHLTMTETEYRHDYHGLDFFNHHWNDPAALVDIGAISAEKIFHITAGLMKEKIHITINQMIFNYDRLLVIGPVFPHEVAGFSGGSKYFFPGISGPEIIDFFHWLGAVITNLKIIGKADNSARRVIDEAANLVPVPADAISLVIHEGKTAGLFVGGVKDSWEHAVKLSSKLHIVRKAGSFRRVLSCAPPMYDDLWTGGKCMYKCEPVVAAGGELIIFAPHITSFSYTHGRIMEKIGYHVRDYYLKQKERFQEVPRTAMAVSTYLKGSGAYDNNRERPRIRVKLATGISRKKCEKAGLGYVDPGSIDFSEWQNKEEEGILFVEKGGETLYLPE